LLLAAVSCGRTDRTDAVSGEPRLNAPTRAATRYTEPPAQPAASVLVDAAAATPGAPRSEPEPAPAPEPAADGLVDAAAAKPAAPPHNPAPDNEPQEAPPPHSLALYDRPPSDTPGAPQTRFSIAHTRDLYACSSWSALEGEHFETRRFYAPQGELYYQKLLPFSTDTAEPHPFTHPVAIPHATTIQPVLPNQRGELVVCDALAVAGAWIGDHQLTGAWRIEVVLDGATSPAISQAFEIVP
jgi:hypothetical protein